MPEFDSDYSGEESNSSSFSNDHRLGDSKNSNDHDHDYNTDSVNECINSRGQAAEEGQAWQAAEEGQGQGQVWQGCRCGADVDRLTPSR